MENQKAETEVIGESLGKQIGSRDRRIALLQQDIKNLSSEKEANQTKIFELTQTINQLKLQDEKKTLLRAKELEPFEKFITGENIDQISSSINELHKLIDERTAEAEKKFKEKHFKAGSLAAKTSQNPELSFVERMSKAGYKR